MTLVKGSTFESCPLHHASQHTIFKRKQGKDRGR